MKNKFLLSSIVALATVSLLSAQTESEAINSQTPKVDYEKELYLQNMYYGSSNPVSIAYNPYSVINSFDGSYSRAEGNFKPIDGAGNANLTDFGIYGAKKLDKISFEGSLKYRVHELNNSRWGNTVLLSYKNPFIIADSLIYDSVPNNHEREIFDLNGGFAWKTTDRLVLGLRANYLVGSKADQSDPRFESHGARVTFNPGVEYKLGNSFSLGLSAGVATYHEDVEMTVVDNILDPAHCFVFLFKELGNYEIKNETGYNRRYDGSIYTGALQAVYTGEHISNFLEIGAEINNEEAIDGGTSYKKKGGENNIMTLSFKDRLQYRGASMIHNLSVEASMLNEKAKVFNQTAAPDSYGKTVWIIQSSDISQKESDLNANISYQLDLLSKQVSHFTAKVSGGFEKVSVNQYPDEYFAKYSLMNAGIDVTKRFYYRKFHFSLSGNGGYCKAMNKLEYELPSDNPGKKRFMRGYFIPKYEYLASDYIQYGLSASVAYHIQNKQWVKLSAGYSSVDYKGDYSRFDNRSNLFVKLTYTL